MPKLLHNLSWTREPLAQGGLVLYEAEGDPGVVRAEIWRPGLRTRWKTTIWSWVVKDDAFRDLDWVSPRDWERIAERERVSPEILREMARDPLPAVRARVYLAAGEFLGLNRLDPHWFTVETSEMEERWPQLRWSGKEWRPRRKDAP